MFVSYKTHKANYRKTTDFLKQQQQNNYIHNKNIIKSIIINTKYLIIIFIALFKWYIWQVFKSLRFQPLFIFQIIMQDIIIYNKYCSFSKIRFPV